MVCLLGLGASAQTPIKVTFPMNDKTNSADKVEGSVDVPDVLESAVLEYGSSTALNRIRKYGTDLNAASFTAPMKTTTENSAYSVSFVITPGSGVKYQPTNVSALIGGSKSGNLQFAVEISNGEGESQTLQSKTSAAKNNEDGVMTDFNKSVSALSSLNSPVTVTIYILNKDTSKDRELMITNVVITGEYVVEGGPVYTKLAKPVITADNSAYVTITASAEASAIKYTTNGTDPSADNGEVYTEPFKVADETIVKAIALGDVENLTLDSDIAELCVYDNSITVATPVIKQQNGTVGIYCSTPKATVEYSFDNATWTAYARPFTLAENATVYARATRENCTDSDVASLEVNSVIPAVEGATFKLMANGSFEHKNDTFADNGYTIAVGKEGDNVEGYELILMNTGKKDISGGNKVLVPEINATRTTIKTSGVPCTYQVVVPNGYRAARVTLYSYVNYATGTPTYWSEVNGVNYSDEVPFGAITGTGNFEKEVPDARVFDLRDAKGNGAKEFTFTCSGLQTCFVVGMDIVEEVYQDVYFVGAQTGWNTSDPDYKFTTTDGVTYSLTLPEGITGEWKICNGTWDWSFGRGASVTLNEACEAWFDAANFNVKTTGETTITFTLVDGSDVKNSSIPSIVTIEGEPFVESEEHNIYLAGAQTNWAAGKLEFTKNDNGVYTLELEDGLTGEWKIIRDDSWLGLNENKAILPYVPYLLAGGNNFTFTSEGTTILEVEIEGAATYVTVKTRGYDAVYFDNTDSKWDAVYAYFWKEGEGDYVAWPGLAMSQVPAPAVVTYAATDKDIYEVAVPITGYDKIIFNNNNNGSQTGDLDLHLGYIYKADGTSTEYDGTTGIDEIAVDDANVAPIYYNLQGARVANPANGAYIMVRGSKVTKVIR